MNSLVAPGGQPTGTFWVMDLARSLASPSPARMAVQFREVGPEGAPELARAMGLARLEPLLQRFAAGRRCYAGYVEGGAVLAVYGWVSFDREHIGELNLTLYLPRGTAYIWDCATLPAYRGQHLYPALLVYIAGVLREQGIERVWIGADADNEASNRGMARAGFVPVADVFSAPAGSTRLVLRGRSGVSAALLADLCRALPGIEVLSQEAE
jgi:ribosomal protein S18 acetylase RimI-like enzyme